MRVGNEEPAVLERISQDVGRRAHAPIASAGARARGAAWAGPIANAKAPAQRRRRASVSAECEASRRDAHAVGGRAPRLPEAWRQRLFEGQRERAAAGREAQGALLEALERNRRREVEMPGEIVFARPLQPVLDGETPRHA